MDAKGNPECYNFHGIRDFLKKYKSKLQNPHNRPRHLNRSRSFVLPRNNVKDKPRQDSFKADNDKNKDSGVKKLGSNGEKEHHNHKKSKKHESHGNHVMNDNNINYHNINNNNNNGCFKTIILLNASKKKQAPSKVSASDDLPDNFASNLEKKGEKTTPSRATSFETKPYLGRSTSVKESNKRQQEWGTTPNNSREASMNRNLSTGSRTSSLNNNGNGNGRTINNNNSKPAGGNFVNRSTSMNMSRSRGNNNVVMNSFRSFNKSRSGHIIMFSNSTGILKPPPMEQELECTLEELCHGCVKNIRVSRDVYSSTGKISQEEEVLRVNIKPGWKSGTKITFQGGTSTTTEDKQGGGQEQHRADVVFIITEKPHKLFRRNGDDLEMEMDIPLVDALTGCTLTIPLVDGQNMTMAIDDIVYPGYQKLLPGRGMPNQKTPHQRGHLKIKFTVDFPKCLTQQQQLEVSKVFTSVDFQS